jgi:hypothetical protein
LHPADGLAIIRIRFGVACKTLTKSSSYIRNVFATYNEAGKKEVDDKRETLHNLISLLLTNKTIRRTQQGSTEQVL